MRATLHPPANPVPILSIMLPPEISPTLAGHSGPIGPTICRISPDLKRVAFWAPDALVPGLYLAAVSAEKIDDSSSEPIFLPDHQHLSDLAWSPDGRSLAFALTSGPPPGEVRIGILRVADQVLTILPGMSFAWAGGSSLLIADPHGQRLYFRDIDQAADYDVGPLDVDGDPHFPPVISISPDVRRFALVTRKVLDHCTRVHLGQHDGQAWEIHPLSDLPGTSIRIFPFWSADSVACALYIIDLEQHHTVIIGIPHHEGPGDILYTSDTVDAAIAPAAYPGGRLIAMIRAHPRPDAKLLNENRLVMFDPAEHAVAPLTPDNTILGQLRFLDEQTLLVEGRSIWAVTFRAELQTAPPKSIATRAIVDSPFSSAGAGGPVLAAPPAVSEDTPADTLSDAAAEIAFARTTVQSPNPAWTFSAEIPTNWQRVPLPPDEPDFADPRIMRPLCLYTPAYAAIVFTVAVRPALPGSTIPGAAPEAALEYLAKSQGMALADLRTVLLPFGPAAQAMARQETDAGPMTLRLLLVEHAGWLFSLTAMAPAPLYDALKPALDRMVNSFRMG